MTHTSQSPSLIMQTRDGGNRKELQGIIKVCLFILCLVLSGLLGSKAYSYYVWYYVRTSGIKMYNAYYCIPSILK